MEFKGATVFIDCGGLGTYQGLVGEVDSVARTITIAHGTKDSVPLDGPVVVNSGEILNIKVLKLAVREVERPARKSKTVAALKATPSSTTTTTTTRPREQPLVVETPKAAVAVPLASVVLNSTAAAAVQPQEERRSPISTNGINIMRKLLVAPLNDVPVPPVLNQLFRAPHPPAPAPAPVPLSASTVSSASSAKATTPQPEQISSAAVTDREDSGAPAKAQRRKKKKDHPSTTSSKQPQSLKVESEKENRKSPAGEKKSADKTTAASSSQSVVTGGLRINPTDLIRSVEAPISPTPSSMASSKQSTATPVKKDLSFKQYGDFKKFTEKQQPIPVVPPGNANGRKRREGPSGDPVSDFSNGYGRVHRRNRDLDVPLNPVELDKDFDFDSNLALFNKDDVVVSDSADDAKEAPADMRNYRHDENVIHDPARVTSWITKLQAKLPFNHVTMTLTKTGNFLPVLSAEEKAKFISIVTKNMGLDVFNTIVADRVFQRLEQIVSSYSLAPAKSLHLRVAVLASNKTNVVLVDRLCTHLSNHLFETVVYGGAKPRITLPHIAPVKDVSGVSDVQIIVVLDDEIANSVASSWLIKVANGTKPAHVLGIDGQRLGYVFWHAVYLGALTCNKPHSPPPGAPASRSEGTRVVADLGVPYSWFQDEAVSALANAFDGIQLADV